MAVRAAVIEGKGALKADRLDHYKNLMKTLWQEIADIADEDGVSVLACSFNGLGYLISIFVWLGSFTGR